MIVCVVGLIVAMTSPGKAAEVSPSSTARTWLPLGASATETVVRGPAMPVPLVGMVVVSV